MAGYGYDDANSALQAMGDNSSDPVTKALIGNITGTLPRKRVLDVRGARETGGQRITSSKKDECR